MSKQNMIAVSEDAKTYVQAMSATFGGPSKTKDYLAMSEREAIDTLVAVAESVRKVERIESDDEGNETIVFVDLVALEADRTLALRAATSRANSAASKLEAKEKEIAELKAMLEKLQGVTA
jgi:hypothetical protein